MNVGNLLLSLVSSLDVGTRGGIVVATMGEEVK